MWKNCRSVTEVNQIKQVYSKLQGWLKWIHTSCGRLVSLLIWFNDVDWSSKILVMRLRYNKLIFRWPVACGGGGGGHTDVLGHRSIGGDQPGAHHLLEMTKDLDRLLMTSGDDFLVGPVLWSWENFMLLSCFWFYTSQTLLILLYCVVKRNKKTKICFNILFNKVLVHHCLSLKSLFQCTCTT